MLKSWLLFLAFLILCSAAFVGGASSFSPTFQECVHAEQKAEYQQSAKIQPPSLRAMASRYIPCTGTFVDAHGSGITALATIIIAAFTGTLWVATSRQALLTREALIADKRAFVFAPGFTQEYELDSATGRYSWRFRPVWRNSGNTPTKNMRQYATCEIRNSVLPTGFDFDPTDATYGTGFMPPSMELQAMPTPPIGEAAITPHDIADAQAGRKFIYLWGWAKYYDVFPGTREHVTRFCWLILASGDPFAFQPNTLGAPPTPGALTFSYLGHREGNSTND